MYTIFLTSDAASSVTMDWLTLLVVAIILIIGLVLLIAGVKRKGANIAAIILFALIVIYVLIALAVAGANFSVGTCIAVGVSILIIVIAAANLIKLKKKYVEKESRTAEKKGSSTTDTNGNRQETVNSFKGRLLDKDKALSVALENNNGDKIDFERIDALYSNVSGEEKLYAVLKMVGGADDTVYIAEYVEDGGYLETPADAIADKVFNEWQQGLNGRKNKKLVLNLVDTIVHKSDWKQFRKSATQEELTVLAIGSKYNLGGAKFFTKAGVSVIGTILSVVLGITLVGDIGWFAIIILVGGYLFFNLMASKILGYSDTYRSCYSKLNAKNREYIKSLFKENIAVSALRVVVLAALTIFTIPYKFILMIIETFVPAARNWTVAHGGEAGAVISLPKGYDIGGLGAVGEYYASFKFSDAWQQQMEEYEAARLAKFSEYTYQDKNGVLQKAYSDDGTRFYASTDKLTEVGTSTDGGRTMERKGYYEQKDSRGNTSELKES